MPVYRRTKLYRGRQRLRRFVQSKTGSTLYTSNLSGTAGALSATTTKSPRKSLTGISGSILASLTKRTNKALSGSAVQLPLHYLA